MTAVPDSIGFIYERDLVRISGVPRSTRQHWVAKGLLRDPPDGRFREREVVETVILGRLVQALKPEHAQVAWGQQGDEVLAAVLAVEPGRTRQLDLVVNVDLATISLAKSDRQIGALIRSQEQPRHYVVFPLAAVLREAREAFWRFTRTPRKPADNRRRDSRQPRGARRSG